MNSKASVAQDIRSGKPLIYRVKFPLQYPLPKLTKLYCNGFLLCSGPGVNSFPMTNIKLEHNINTGLTALQINENIQQVQQKPPVYSTLASTTRRPQTVPPSVKTTTYRPVTEEPIAHPPTPKPMIVNQYLKDNDVCGQPIIQGTGLIVGGKAAIRGQWPWLVAYYEAIGAGKFKFSCGGSLVSSRHVITAAHCVHEKHTQEAKKAENALMYIGKHHLENELEEGYRKVKVTKIKVHPDWKPFDSKYDADIAIIFLEISMQYTKYIRPLCLWSQSSTDIRDIENRNGVVVGWGKNQEDAINYDEPKMLKIPVVSRDTCLLSSESFYYIITTRTFCAGQGPGHNDEGPCNGDSGGGFIMNIGNRWMLRGIISASLADPTSGKCDTSQYTVMTDAALFLEWIKQEVSKKSS